LGEINVKFGEIKIGGGEVVITGLEKKHYGGKK
jgi:hypothetical protein